MVEMKVEMLVAFGVYMKASKWVVEMVVLTAVEKVAMMV